MFKIVSNPTFTHEVKVAVPCDGGYRDESCRATFRVIPHGEGANLNLGDADESTEFLRKIVVSIDDIADDNGNALPWNDEVRDQLFANFPYLRRALARTYFTALQGERVKN